MYTVSAPTLTTAGLTLPLVELPSSVLQVVAAIIVVSAVLGLLRLGPRFALDYVRSDHDGRHRLRVTRNGAPVARRP